MVYKKESLIKRIEKLKEYGHDLKEMGNISFDVYIKDKKLRYSIERLLFLISENILDFLDHVLSSKYKTVSDSYEEIIENAYKRGIIESSIHGNIKGLGGFRNILAHEYLTLSDDEVFRNLEKIMSLLDTIISEFEKIIENQ